MVKDGLSLISISNFEISLYTLQSSIYNAIFSILFLFISKFEKVDIFSRVMLNDFNSVLISDIKLFNFFFLNNHQ